MNQLVIGTKNDRVLVASLSDHGSWIRSRAQNTLNPSTLSLRSASPYSNCIPPLFPRLLLRSTLSISSLWDLTYILFFPLLSF